MPNWVSTVINFWGKQEDIDTIFDLIKGEYEDGEGRAIDFEKIIPMPDYIYQGDLGMTEREQYGKNNWYDWSIENWGTKWNACHTNRFGNSLEFDTAWSLCDPILEKLAELCYEHKVTFDGYFCDEDWSSSNKGFIGMNYGNFYVNCVDGFNLEDEDVKEILINCYGEDCYEDMLEDEREQNGEDEDD